jgi:hypothetical protein
MPVTDDELALRTALADATVGQPDMPVDRLVGVRRRYVRRRRLQGVAAAAAVAVLAAGTVIGIGAVRGTGGHVTEPVSPAPKAWQLPWPTRIDPDTAEARTAASKDLRNAMGSYAERTGLRISDNRLLYAGTPYRSDVRWIVSEATVTAADGGDGPVHQLFGFATTDRGASWTTFVDAAPTPSVQQVGFAWSPPHGSSTVFVFGSPAAGSTGLLDLSSGFTSLEHVGTPLVFSAAVLPLGHRATPGTLFVGPPDLHTNYPVAVPEDTATSARIPAWQRALPPSSVHTRRLSTLTGAGGGNRIDMRTDHAGRVGVDIQCAGPVPLVITLRSATASVRIVERTCEGDVEFGRKSLLLGAHERLTVTVEADEALSFAVGIYQAR